MLTSRDCDALRLIYAFRFLTIQQATLCLFHNRNVAQRRLQAIENTGVALSFPVPTGTRGQPSKVYYLNAGRRRAIEERLCEPLVSANLCRSLPENLIVTRHTVELNDLLVTLHAAAKLRGYRFSFLPEYQKEPKLLDEEVRDPTRQGMSIRYRRDALCCFFSERSAALFEVEYDRGKEVVQATGSRQVTVERKIVTFLQGLKERTFARYARYFAHEFATSRLMLVTTSEERLRNIARLCLGMETHGLMYLSTMERLRPETAFSRVWLVPDNGRIEERELGQ